MGGGLSDPRFAEVFHHEFEQSKLRRKGIIMFVSKEDFPKLASELLGVHIESIENVMSLIDGDHAAGVTDHNPMTLGEGMICGPTSGEWMNANNCVDDSICDGFYRVARFEPITNR